MVVIDASVTLAWCFPDEATSATEALLDAARSRDVHVPAIWAFEVANVIAQAERRGRLPQARSAEFIAMLGVLAVAIDTDGLDATLGDGLRLARAYRLTAYDAAYLELALRLGLPLATRDADLADTARAAGVEVMAV